MTTSPMCEIASPRKLVAFPWYGGKATILDWLLPLLPKTVHYCEPFGGAASVLLNRDQSKIETYNDIYDDVYLFFKVLRDKPRQLIRAISLTPYSRREYEQSLVIDPTLSDVERARRFFARACMTYVGASSSTTLGSWGVVVTAHVRRSLSSRAERLRRIADRLLRVQLENRNAVDVIRKYDGESTLFYCDPPYAAESRANPHEYKHEMANEDYREFADAVNRAVGKVAISGYDCDLMRRLFPPPKWRITKRAPHRISPALHRAFRQECLWTNYDVPHHADQSTRQLFMSGSN